MDAKLTSLSPYTSGFTYAGYCLLRVLPRSAHGRRCFNSKSSSCKPFAIPKLPLHTSRAIYARRSPINHAVRMEDFRFSTGFDFLRIGSTADILPAKGYFQKLLPLRGRVTSCVRARARLYVGGGVGVGASQGARELSYIPSLNFLTFWGRNNGRCDLIFANQDFLQNWAKRMILRRDIYSLLLLLLLGLILLTVSKVAYCQQKGVDFIDTIGLV